MKSFFLLFVLIMATILNPDAYLGRSVHYVPEEEALQAEEAKEEGEEELLPWDDQHGDAAGGN